MIHKRFNNIQNKIFLGFLIIILVAVFGLSSIYFKKFNSFINEQTYNYQSQLLEQIGARFDEIKIFSDVYQTQVISFITKDRKKLTNEQNIYYYKKDIENLIVHTKMAFNNKFNVFVIDPQLGILTDQSLRRKIFFEQKWYHDSALEAVEVGEFVVVNKDVHYYIFDNKPMLSFVKKIKIFEKSIGYNIIQLDVNFEEITKIVSHSTLNNEEILLIGDDGYIIYSSKAEQIGKNLDDLSEQYAWLTKSAQTEEGFFGYEDAIVITKHLKESNWLLVKYIPKDIYYNDFNEVVSKVILFILLFTIIGLILSYFISKKITKPIKNVVNSMAMIKDGNFDISVKASSDHDMKVLADGFNTMVQQIDVLMKDVIKKEKEKRKIELNALQSQISTHFLYNTLNSLKWMAINSQVMDIANAIVALINVLKYITKDSDCMVQVQEECEFLKSYATVQKMRYGEIFNIVNQVSEEMSRCLIPKLIFQPIIENAIVHAFSNTTEKGVIAIGGQMTENELHLKISDNGSGFDLQTRAGKGVGLSNVDKRLKLHYGLKYGISIQSSENGTTVTIGIPVMLSGGE
ncbi:MAG: histidine kinase [Vallitaleaceae bacterium]|nr:histidine kinase [Vallitaleaceae bacterium]